MLFFTGWWYRERRWGAFLWGLLSAVIGQIHMSGFFLALAFVIWERREEHRRARPQAIRWRWATGGALVGGIGLAVWIVVLGTSLVSWVRTAGVPAQGPRGIVAADVHLLSLWPSFWFNWFSDATGFGLEYSLGDHYLDFLAGPMVAGHRSWIALLATAASLALALPVVIPWARSILQDLRARRLAERVRTCGETAFAEAAAIGVCGVMFTASLLTSHRHYLIVLYPLPWVWLARITLARRRGRARLAAMWTAQLVVSLSFLGYIHAHHGADGDDYGIGYRWQTSQSDRTPIPGYDATVAPSSTPTRAKISSARAICSGVCAAEQLARSTH
jgi:hypothetical protein